jgi:hypothetical protein
VRQLHLDLTVTPFAFEDFRLRSPTLGNIHVGADEFDEIAGVVVDRMAYRVDVPGAGAWKDDPKIQLVFGAVTDCSFGGFSELGSIPGVNAPLKRFERGMPASASKPYSRNISRDQWVISRVATFHAQLPVRLSRCAWLDGTRSAARPVPRCRWRHQVADAGGLF